MTRRINWSREALDDLKGEVAYIAADNPRAAQQVSDTLTRTAAALSDMPTGRPGRVTGTYEKTVTGLRYIIAYALTGDPDHGVVTILHVIHTSRDWQPESWPR
ncbi:type II toxin-antitoxin system RelE/ParE family toxin [Palleronia rufa]|uniref:type II toxin-antitoxin system RelE/ParE family toxin n=1 Tax=Palleronia rufa TaxID=1530186 RepID=UPI0005673F35|nr:type II toxin-antitoxin system RelE/ParE family toxin [Palleronia rufa]